MGQGSGGKLAVAGEIEKKQWVGPPIHPKDHTLESGPQTLTPCLWAGLVVMSHQNYSHMQMSQPRRPLWAQFSKMSECIWVRIHQRGQHACWYLLCSVSHFQTCVVTQAKSERYMFYVAVQLMCVTSI